MASTDLLQFNPAAINQQNDATYLADSNRTGGFGTDAIVPSPLLNKVIYQSSTFIAAFGQMMAAKGYTTSDADVSVLAAVLANLITEADELPSIATVAYSPTPAFNAGAANGFQMTLSGNVTASTITGVTAGQLVAFYFLQDATGGRTVSWPAGVTGTVQPDPTPSAITLFLFRADLSSVLHAAAPSVSSAGLVTIGSLTLSSPGTSGQVLTNVGGLFIPQTPPARGLTVNNVTGSRALNTIYNNASASPMTFSGYATTSGSATGRVRVLIGSSSPPTLVDWGNEATATVSGGDAGFRGEVPPGWYYELTSTGAITGIGSWLEKIWT
jgi:hypothetical protein